MVNISSPKTVKQLLERYSLAPLKKLGQNFLIDGNILKSIVGALDYKSGFVVEVGAGLGALTIRLAGRAKKVLAYEIDSGLVGALQETLCGVDNAAVKQIGRASWRERV